MNCGLCKEATPLLSEHVGFQRKPTGQILISEPDEFKKPSDFGLTLDAHRGLKHPTMNG